MIKAGDPAATYVPAPLVRGKPRLATRMKALGLAGTAAGVVVMLSATVAVLAPWIARQDPNVINLADVFSGTSFSHPLGADALGRDLLSRLIWGSRTALLGPLIVISIATVVGSGLAIAMAWLGGWFDSILSRALDVVFAFPGLLLALLAVAIFGAGLASAAIALAIAYAPYMARVTRGAAIRERRLPYIEACSVQGFSGLAICLRHLLPNVFPLILAQATVTFGYAMIDLAAVSYLGLGVQPPTADWGSMIQIGQASVLQGHPQESVFAGLAVVVVVVAFNFFGQRLLNPVETARG